MAIVSGVCFCSSAGQWRQEDTSSLLHSQSNLMESHLSVRDPVSKNKGAILENQHLKLFSGFQSHIHKCIYIYIARVLVCVHTTQPSQLNHTHIYTCTHTLHTHVCAHTHAHTNTHTSRLLKLTPKISVSVGLG